MAESGSLLWGSSCLIVLNDKKYRIEFKNGCGSSNIHKVTSRESRRPISPGDPHVANGKVGTLSTCNLFVKGSE